MSVLEKCPLFEGITEDEIKSVLDCLKAKKTKYKKGDYIFEAGQKVLLMGVVLSGTANIVQDDFWGNRTILARIAESDIFGEAFACSNIKEAPVSVVCMEPVEVLFIDYLRITKTCSSACVFHSKLIANMINILAIKNILLTKKIEHITKRTTREKLLSYLSEQAKLTQSSSFTIPFDRQGLADYLAVDRSAMSNELSKLREDGVLRYHKNEFELIED